MSGYKSFPDDELLRLLKESDHSAYNEIYRRYFYLTYTHAHKKLRDEEQAKDVVQEVFTSLWFKRETNLPRSNLPAYLYTAVRYKIFDLFAHQQVKNNYMESFKVYFDNYQSPPTDHLIRERQLQAYIDREIQKLPGKMRAIIELNKKEGLSRKEIAQLLNTTESSVSKNLSIALKILKTKLSLIAVVYYFFVG